MVGLFVGEIRKGFVAVNTATEMLWLAAGSPPQEVEGDRPKEPCGMCGGGFCLQGRPLNTIGKGKSKIQGWLKPTFTAYPMMANFHERAWICEACLFSVHEDADVPGTKTNYNENTGKATKKKMRNYSHLVEGRSWTPATKAEEGRQEIRDFLLRPHGEPWFACIAQSGQKHILFLTRPNPPNHRTDLSINVQFEQDVVVLVPDVFKGIIQHYEALYTVFTKAEIDGGDYSPKRIMEFGLPQMMGIENCIKQHRGSGAFTLAGFLAIRRDREDEEVVEILGRYMGGGERGSPPEIEHLDTLRPSTAPEGGRESTNALGSDPGRDRKPRAADHELEGVVGESDQGSTDREPQQLSLFGF